MADRVLATLNEMETISGSNALPEPADSALPAATPLSGMLSNGAAIGRFVVTAFVGQGRLGSV
jgi:hypothetical protein